MLSIHAYHASGAFASTQVWSINWASGRLGHVPHATRQAFVAHLRGHYYLLARVTSPSNTPSADAGHPFVFEGCHEI